MQCRFQLSRDRPDKVVVRVTHATVEGFRRECRVATDTGTLHFYSMSGTFEFSRDG